MLRWFHRRWIKRTKYEAVTAIYECRIEALEQEIEELRRALGRTDAATQGSHAGLALFRQIAREARRTV